MKMYRLLLNNSAHIFQTEYEGPIEIDRICYEDLTEEQTRIVQTILYQYYTKLSDLLFLLKNPIVTIEQYEEIKTIKIPYANHFVGDI